MGGCMKGIATRFIAPDAPGGDLRGNSTLRAPLPFALVDMRLNVALRVHFSSHSGACGAGTCHCWA